VKEQRCKDCKHLIGLECDLEHRCTFGNIDNMNICKYYKSKEAKLKDTITLKELIKKGACKEWLLWFIDNREYFDAEIMADDRGKMDTAFFTKYIALHASVDGRHNYIQWLKGNGYVVDDKQKKIDSIQDKIDALQKELEELK
jgi:hypothetical protein